MNQYFILNTENMKTLPVYLSTSGIDFEETEMIRAEGFNEYLMLYTSAGTGVLNYQNKAYILEKGDLVLIPKWHPHSYRALNEKWYTHFITFDGNGLEDFFNSMMIDSIYVIKKEFTDNIDIVMKDIYKRTSINYQRNALIISSLIYQMIIDMVQAIQRMDITKFAGKNYVDDAISYMKNHYSEVVTMDELAREVGISPQYLCRLFQSSLGVRPFEYLRQIRVNRSKLLLIEEHHLTVEAIAKKVGFNDASYFGKEFKKYEHMTPKTFAKMHKRN